MIKPMLSSLRHHRLTSVLMLLQVALSCAIVSNVAFMIQQRIERLAFVSGVDEARLSLLVSTAVDPAENHAARHLADLAALRRVAGVQAVSSVDTLPLGRSESSYGACASSQAMDAVIAHHSMDGRADCTQPAVMQVSEQALATLGLHLVAGRDFQPQDYINQGTPAVALISRALADKLYPGRDPLGQVVVTGSRQPIRVIGVIDPILRPRLNTLGSDRQVMLWPLRPTDASVTYVLRSAAADRDAVLQRARQVLLGLDRQRVIDPTSMQTYQQLRAGYFHRDTTMLGLLVASALGLLLVSMLGIGGLANFWVQQRWRTIGVRRAVGATRGDIQRYFHLENLLIVSMGIALGLLLAYVLNLLLMQRYELPRLPWLYPPLAALLIAMLGQLAVLAPALRASRVPPVVATRSV